MPEFKLPALPYATDHIDLPGVAPLVESIVGASLKKSVGRSRKAKGCQRDRWRVYGEPHRPGHGLSPYDHAAIGGTVLELRQGVADHLAMSFLVSGGKRDLPIGAGMGVDFDNPSASPFGSVHHLHDAFGTNAHAVGVIDPRRFCVWDDSLAEQVHIPTRPSVSHEKDRESLLTRGTPEVVVQETPLCGDERQSCCSHAYRSLSRRWTVNMNVKRLSP